MTHSAARPRRIVGFVRNRMPDATEHCFHPNVITLRRAGKKVSLTVSITLADALKVDAVNQRSYNKFV